MIRLVILLFACSTARAQIGILGAFNEEVNLLLLQVQEKKLTIIQKIAFTTGVLKGQPVVIAQTGVGKVNAAIVTTLLLEHFKPKAVLFTGIAGAVNPALQPGDIVVGTRVAHHDYGKLTDTMSVQNTNNNPLYFLCDSALLRLAMQQKASIAARIITGTIVTGDVFVAAESVTTRLRRQLQADATDMESAAVAQVCWQQGTKFLAIRSVSDRANNNAHADAMNFYKTAARNSANLIMAILSSLQ